MLGRSLLLASPAAALLLLMARPAHPAHADDPPRLADQHFTIDPVSDITPTAGGTGFATLLGLILSTGEIRPFPVQPGNQNKLLVIDQIAVTRRGSRCGHRRARPPPAQTLRRRAARVDRPAARPRGGRA